MDLYIYICLLAEAASERMRVQDRPTPSGAMCSRHQYLQLVENDLVGCKVDIQLFVSKGVVGPRFRGAVGKPGRNTGAGERGYNLVQHACHSATPRFDQLGEEGERNMHTKTHTRLTTVIIGAVSSLAPYQLRRRDRTNPTALLPHRTCQAFVCLKAALHKDDAGRQSSTLRCYRRRPNLMCHGLISRPVGHPGQPIFNILAHSASAKVLEARIVMMDGDSAEQAQPPFSGRCTIIPSSE